MRLSVSTKPTLFLTHCMHILKSACDFDFCFGEKQIDSLALVKSKLTVLGACGMRIGQTAIYFCTKGELTSFSQDCMRIEAGCTGLLYRDRIESLPTACESIGTVCLFRRVLGRSRVDSPYST